MSSEATNPPGMIALATWWETNKKTVTKVAIAAAVVALGIYVYTYLNEQKENAASAALVQLVSKEDGPKPKASDYLQIVQNYSGTIASEHALLMAANAFLSESNYQEARAKFEQFLSAYPASPAAANATLGVAATYDAMNDMEKAIAGYQKVISSFPSEGAAAQAKLQLAIIYEFKKDPAQALKLYTELMTTENSWAREAANRHSVLLAEHPELASTNAVPAKANAAIPNNVMVKPMPQASKTTNAPAKKP